jgi:hypothetical protein
MWQWWVRLGLWRWRETQVGRWGFNTPWLKLFASVATAEAQKKAPRHDVECDWSAVPQATHHRIYYRRWFILVVVPWDNWVYRWFAYSQDEGSSAASAYYWETCGHDQDEHVPFAVMQRREFRRAFRRAAINYWWLPLVCRMKGHDCESFADGENGTEDVCCRRCGWGFHAQF